MIENFLPLDAMYAGMLCLLKTAHDPGYRILLFECPREAHRRASAFLVCSRHGWQSIRVSRCITRPPPRPGLISWSGCSPKSPASKSGAAPSRALRTSKPPFTPGSPRGTPSPHPSNGPPRPAKSWKRMPAPEKFWPAHIAVLNE